MLQKYSLHATNNILKCAWHRQQVPPWVPRSPLVSPSLWWSPLVCSEFLNEPTLVSAGRPPLVSTGLRWSLLVSLSLQWSPGDQQRPAETRGDHETNGDLLRHVDTSTIETPGDQWRLNETCGDLWRPVETSEGSWRAVLSVVYTFILLFAVCGEYYCSITI